jgi:hypothetical protein
MAPVCSAALPSPAFYPPIALTVVKTQQKQSKFATRLADATATLDVGVSLDI